MALSKRSAQKGRESAARQRRYWKPPQAKPLYGYDTTKPRCECDKPWLEGHYCHKCGKEIPGGL